MCVRLNKCMTMLEIIRFILKVSVKVKERSSFKDDLLDLRSELSIPVERESEVKGKIQKGTLIGLW